MLTITQAKPNQAKRSLQLRFYHKLSVVCNYALILLIPLFLLSCKGVDDISFTGVDDFVFRGMENNKISFSASVGVSNPSSIAFKVNEVNLKTSIDGVYIGTLTSDNTIRVPARTDSLYNMDFTVNLSNLITGASTLYNASRKKKVEVEMNGYVKARSWFTVKKVEVNEKQLIDVPSINR